MKKTRKIGIGFIVSTIAFFVIGKLLSINTWLAKKICGDQYMIEPDSALRAQGVLTESACGFDSDMYAVAFAFLLLITGVSLLLISLKK